MDVDKEEAENADSEKFDKNAFKDVTDELKPAKWDIS